MCWLIIVNHTYKLRFICIHTLSFPNLVQLYLNFINDDSQLKFVKTTRKSLFFLQLCNDIVDFSSYLWIINIALDQAKKTLGHFF